MDSRRNLSVEDEKQLQIDFSQLYYSNEKYFSYSQIAELLQFGVSGTKYEKLNVNHLLYYYIKFHFAPRGYSRKIELIQKKKKPKKRVLRNLPKWRRMNIMKVAQMWDEFDGSWTEFVKHIENL